MDLASRDSYIQKLASKVLNQQDEDKKKKKRPFGEIIYTLHWIHSPVCVETADINAYVLICVNKPVVVTALDQRGALQEKYVCMHGICSVLVHDKH